MFHGGHIKVHSQIQHTLLFHSMPVIILPNSTRMSSNYLELCYEPLTKNPNSSLNAKIF